MKDYNHFTVAYIKAVKTHLKIEIKSDGYAVFLPEKISQYDFLMLSVELTKIFENSASSIEVVRNRIDSNVQAGLFGMIDDFDKAIKTGFLIADRIVLIDYLYERVLKKRINNINISHIGSIASSLVQLLPLAEQGRIVMIPNPFEWYENSKLIIEEASVNTTLTLKLMSMLNMLSITKECKLHPYTISESDEEYKLILDDNIDQTDLIGKTAGDYAYQGILASLLTERLLDNVEFKVVKNMPLSKYYNIITANESFHKDYIKEITSRGVLEGDIKVNEIRNLIKENIEDRNSKLPTKIKNLAILGTSASTASISIWGVTKVISTPLTISSILLGIAPSLIGLLRSKDAGETPVINVFSNLIDSE